MSAGFHYLYRAWSVRSGTPLRLPLHRLQTHRHGAPELLQVDRVMLLGGGCGVGHRKPREEDDV